MSLSGFTAPVWFLLLLAVLALAVGYLLAQRLRRRRTLRFTNLALLESVAPRRQRAWRHLPAVVLVLALVALTVALAGPTSEQKVARNRATVVLAVDVSLSMEATDVTPSRIVAAQTAAKAFADGLTPGVNLGVVAFAGTATVLLSPTTDRNAAKAAIDSLQLAERTATGEAIFTSLQSISTLSAVLGGQGGDPVPARVVLLSDGKQTVPEYPDDPRGSFTAAAAAKSAGVPVSTISFGTTTGRVGIDGRTTPVPVDDASMRRIAQIAGGDFYTASSISDLSAIYDTLAEQIGYETTFGDASRPWLLTGTLLAVLAAVGSLVLTQRLP
jgi:Ca-activated chloride channel family protein